MVTTKSSPNLTANVVAIPFTKDKAISTTQLMKLCSEAELLKEFRAPSIKFIQYKNHQLILKCTFVTGDYDLKFKATEEELQIACSCKGKQPGACIHICKTVSVISDRYGEKYFGQLIPNHEFDLAFKYRHGFDRIESELGICLVKRKEVMQLFPFDKPDFPMALDDILSIKVPPEKEIPEKREAVAFLLMLPYGGKQPPFIATATGKLTKGNDRIVSWTAYTPVLDSEAEKLVTFHQKDLIAKCSRLREKSEDFGKEAEYRRWPIWNSKMMAAFHEWKKVFPLLQNEPLIYSYTYYGIREFKRRPSKSHANKITVSMERPEVYFKVNYVKDRFQISLGIRINGRTITYFDAQHPFFLIHQGTLYMFNNYQDAAIVQWMVSAGHITAYNEHKKELADTILKPLSDKYKLTQ